MKLVDKYDKGKSGIYIITNLVNNKVYIGQSIDLWTRINEGYLQKLHKNKGHNIHLQRAWDKYGKDNFRFEVLEYVEDHDKLNEIETKWISEYNASNNKYGYNIQSEGGSPRGSVKSEEAKRKQSIAVSGKGNGMYGKTHTDEIKMKLAELRSIPIVQLDLSGNFIREWESVKNAADYFKINRTPITCVLRKKTFTSCGYIWVYKEEYDSINFNVKEHFNKFNDRKRAIVQLDFNGKLIKEYESANAAYKETNIKNITSVCQGNVNYAGNFVWMYKDDYKQRGFDYEKYKDLAKRHGRVIQITCDGKLIKTWNSIKDVALDLKCSESSINSSCLGKNRKSKGFIWLYEEDYYLNGIPYDRLAKRKNTHSYQPVVQITLNGEFVCSFDSIIEAQSVTGIIASNITAVCKKHKNHNTAGGFKWLYLDEYNLIKIN